MKWLSVRSWAGFKAAAIATVVFALAGSAAVVQAQSAGEGAVPARMAEAPNGNFVVEVPSGQEWTAVATHGFGWDYSARDVLLGGDYDVVRVRQVGGTAAHIDCITLDGTGATGVDGSNDPLALAKLAASDSDVTDAGGASLVLRFIEPGSVLRLDARIQGDMSRALPFQYPANNSFEKVHAGSEFYTYEVGSRMVINTATEPFAKVFTQPDTGHPDGYTYVWVGNDDDDLLVTMDFTSDNTMDDYADYAEVHVNTAAGLRSFRITEADNTWGDVAFTYTDKVSYQHKVYSFRIPLSEIGGPSGDIRFAMSAYGTASIMPRAIRPRIAANPVEDNFLEVYNLIDGSNNWRVFAQFRGTDDPAMSEPWAVDAMVNENWDWNDEPDVAFDSVNERYLVVWCQPYPGEADRVLGYVMTSIGTQVSQIVDISTTVTDKGSPRVSFDPVSERYLVTWDEEGASSRDIRGQMVNADGTLFGTTAGENFAICNAAEYQANANIAYDSANHRFFTCWTDARSTMLDIYGQVVSSAGTLVGTASGENVKVSSATALKMYRNPAVTYEPQSARFLVAMESTDEDIYLQSVLPSGSPTGELATLAQTDAREIEPNIVGAGLGQAYVVWNGDQYPTAVQGVAVDGMAETVGETSQTILAYEYYYQSPAAIAYNSRGSYGVATEKYDGFEDFAKFAAPVTPPPSNDTTPPVTQLTIAGTKQANGWYRSIGRFTLTTEPNALTFFAWNTPVPQTAYTTATVVRRGVNTLSYRSIDSAGNTETVKSALLKVDDYRPRTKAALAGAYRYRYAKLTYKVSDPYTAGVANVTLVIKKGGVVKQRIRLGNRRINTTSTYSWKATLPRGVYRYYVYATDQAGNTQQNVAYNLLYVN